MPMPSYEDVTQRAGSLRAMTGLAETEFQALLPHFEQAFETYLGTRTIDGHPRTSRRYSPYVTCPLLTMADKLLFILSDLTHHPIQELQGQLLEMSQANANKWIHRLHAVLHQALADQELLPARTAEELAVLLAKHKTAAISTSPLFGMMVLTGQSSGRKIPKSRKKTPVARRSGTHAKTSS